MILKKSACIWICIDTLVALIKKIYFVCFFHVWTIIILIWTCPIVFYILQLLEPFNGFYALCFSKYNTDNDEVTSDTSIFSTIVWKLIFTWLGLPLHIILRLSPLQVDFRFGVLQIFGFLKISWFVFWLMLHVLHIAIM